MTDSMISRRTLLTKAALLGCSAAASPLLTPISLASAPWDQRLVVIILRGAMDGLDVVQPIGDPNLTGLRPTLKMGEAAEALPLTNFFTLHPALADLHPLWQKKQLSFAHAVSTPYRDKRSHFDGQDLLEAGVSGSHLESVRDGWMNRMLQTVPGLEAETAYTVGHDNMLLLTGDAPVSNWSPDSGFVLSPQAERLAENIMHDDPLFHATFEEAMALVEPEAMRTNMMGMTPTGRKVAGIDEVARFAGKRLRGQTRIAAFSINGWDTHKGQSAAIGRALGRLTTAILTLREELGPHWKKTTVLAMTEFGRTVRENGARGTDHGTGGAMIMAGGAVRGGQVHGIWPGLAEADLYQRRDLMPTGDVRAYAAWAMRGMFGLEKSVLETAVFPGLEMGADPKILR